jgi:hypothetical protein
MREERWWAQGREREREEEEAIRGRRGAGPCPHPPATWGCPLSPQAPHAHPPPLRGTGVSATAIALSICDTARHTCALEASGGVKCWGNNEYGQLGIGDTSYIRYSPVAVPGPREKGGWGGFGEKEERG